MGLKVTYTGHKLSYMGLKMTCVRLKLKDFLRKRWQEKTETQKTQKKDKRLRKWGGTEKASEKKKNNSENIEGLYKCLKITMY